MSDEDIDEPIAKRKRNRVKNIIDNKFDEDPNKWTYNEKVELYNALIKYGSSNLTLLAQKLPRKSEEHITTYLRGLKSTSRLGLKDNSRKAPIDLWLEYLAHNNNYFKHRITDISLALKYIALFEPRTDNAYIDLSDCYLVLSDCLAGEAPKHMSPENSLFLLENVQKLARKMKTENKESEELFLENFKRKEKSSQLKSYSAKRKSSSNNTDCQASRLTNPLNVPDSLLVIKK